MRHPRRRVAIGIELVWPYKHHTALVAGILARGSALGWHCELEPFLERSGPEGFRGRAFDGVIARMTPSLAAYVRRVGIPAVNVWIDSPVRDFPAVHPDMEAAGRMAADHLADRGFRRLGFLGFRGSLTCRRLSHGFREAAALRGASSEVHLVRWSDFPDGRAWELFQKDLAAWIRSREYPFGVSAFGDLAGRYLAGACLRLGLRIPEDVAIVGTGNNELLCERLHPPLSSIDLGYERVGGRAAEILERMMAGRSAPARPEPVPPSTLVARLSSDAFAVGDPVVSRALRYISENARRPIHVGDVVTGLPVTRRSLERKFRRVLGRTLHDEITRARIDRARRLLAETDTPLKAAALESGFRSIGQFTKAFRRETGQPPAAYRRERRSGGGSPAL